MARRRHHFGPPRVIDPYALGQLDGFFGPAPTAGKPVNLHTAAGEDLDKVKAERADHRAAYGLPQVFAVFGLHAERAILALHRAARTPTYVIPRAGQTRLAEAIATAHAASEPAVIFLVDAPAEPADVQAIYDARAIIPGSGGLLRLGTAAPPAVEQAIHQLGLLTQYRSVHVETPEDAVVALALATGIRR